LVIRWSASVQSRVALGPESGRPIQTLRDHAAAAAAAHMPSAAPDSLCHESHGFSLHARTRVERHDRDQLEKLCRYVARPALSQARLTVRGDGKVLWELRKPWRDGTRAFVFDPLTFLERLVAIMPHPREHQLTYHGTLAPASPLRDDVVLRAPSARENASCEEGADDCTRKKRIPWAELLERVFGADILRCPRCGGRRHMIAQITQRYWRSARCSVTWACGPNRWS